MFVKCTRNDFLRNMPWIYIFRYFKPEGFIFVGEKLIKNINVKRFSFLMYNINLIKKTLLISQKAFFFFKKKEKKPNKEY